MCLNLFKLLLNFKLQKEPVLFFLIVWGLDGLFSQNKDEHPV